MQIEFTVYGEPRPKGRPRFVRMGKFVGTYTPKKTVQAENDFKLQSLKYRPEKPIESPICIRVAFYKTPPQSWSTKKKQKAESGEIYPVTRPDWDNYGKLICDAMNGIFWCDDSQIVRATILKRYSETPRIEVCLNTLPIQFGAITKLLLGR